MRDEHGDLHNGRGTIEYGQFLRLVASLGCTCSEPAANGIAQGADNPAPSTDEPLQNDESDPS